MIKTVEWTDEGIRMIDQRVLPNEEKYLMLRSWEEVAEAIKKMVVRGAPGHRRFRRHGPRAWRESISGHVSRRSGR